MTKFAKAGLRFALLSTSALAISAVAIAPAAAQVTTARVQGQVTSADGAPVAGARITATSLDTGAVRSTTTGAGGDYLLTSLPPGEYRFQASGDGASATRQARLLVGQSATLDIALGAAATAEAPADEDVILVVGTLVESETSEVATNVTQEQIRSLPQTDRNFLSFAALAPGVVYLDGESDKGFQAGAATRSQVNVFIDGVSLKNKLREGGVAGQQNSRGNPFGQLAVQEFRVLTQNYKAEYEQAGSAIITAITKSGTNEFHGEIFGQYTDRSLTEIDAINEREGRPEPAFERKQYGISLGGPIIEDRLFFFGAYEGNDQDRAFNVIAQGTPERQAAFEESSGRTIEEFEGAFVSPFRGDFYFGKLTLTPDDRQTFDVSFSRREESDIQNFGGTNSFEVAENKINTVDTYLFKWAYRGDDFVNEFSANHLDYVFNPTSLNPDLPQFEYQGVLTFGGKDSTRREVQKGYTLRDDFTYTGFFDHTIKFGARVEITDIEFDQQAFVQPRYTFVIQENNNLDFSFPAEARLGLGNSLILASNTQYGLYVQDDWQVTDRLELNLGIRWDYETNGFNNDYVTPDSAAAALRALPTTFFFDPENYITDGDDREPFAGAFQPRIGFSYDLSGDQTTVIFGGAGRYYDRNSFSNTVDEISRVLNPVSVFRFSEDGSDRNGLPTTAFDPSYLTRDGLIALREMFPASGLPQLFAVPEDAKPPVNDQFSLGIRQTFGDWQASVTASYIRGRNGYTHLFATRTDMVNLPGGGTQAVDPGTGQCCNVSPVIPFGYSNVLIGFDGLDTRYKALYFTLDKNYSESSGWGLNIAYTLSKGEQNGNDLFSLDGTVPDSYGWRPRPGDERHRVVISSIVDLPLDFRFSMLTTLGSGRAYQVTDATQGFGNGFLRQTAAYPEKTCVDGIFQFCEVNLTLAKHFSILGNEDRLELAVDLLNAFDNNNYSGFDGFFSDTDPLNPGIEGNSILTLPRRLQFRVGYRF